MKFQKTAIAVTIAGFAAAPMMASADTVLSGVVQVKVQGTDQDGEAGEPRFAAGDVRVGVVSEHELGSGLVGYGSLQLNLDDLTGEGGVNASVPQVSVDEDGSITDEDALTLNSGASVATDNVYVGIKGGFGDIRWGEIPLAVEYGQLANDIHDVADGVEDGLSYTGTFGIFGFGLNYSPAVGEDDNTAATNSDMFGAGVKFNFAGATIGLGFEDRDETVAYAAGASYAIAGFSLAVHYWAKELDFDPDIVINTEAEEGERFDASGFSINDSEALAVKVGYTIAGVSLGLTYATIESEEQDVDADAAGTDELIVANDETVIRLDAGYDLGGGMDISTRIQSAVNDDDDDDEDLVEYRVMLSKSF